MNEVMQSVWAGLGALVQSDLGPVPSPLWHVVVTGQMAHVLIGVSLALFRTRALLVWVVFGCWLMKELLGDIPNAGGALLVVADSLADLCFGGLGYIFSKSRMEGCRNGND